MIQTRRRPAPTPRTKVRRHPERGHYDGDTVRQILDEGLICHLGFEVDGQPYVVPTMYARHGDAVYVHGSPASRMLSTLKEGVPVCLTVTLLDGLVLARSVFNHSMNYRSVMLLGRAVEVTDPAEKMLASQALVDHVVRGRWEEARQPNAKELRTTTILRLPIEEASAKVRSGPPIDGAADMGREVWAGVIPLRLTASDPVPDPVQPDTRRTPGYAAGYRRPQG
jgi:uncharacterized protein